MMKWHRIISLTLLLAMFLAPLMQAAAMNTMAGMVDVPAMTETMSASSDSRHERHGSLDAQPNSPTEAQIASSECHGNAGMLDCCAHCGGWGIPISIRFVPGAAGVEHFTHYGMLPQPVLDPQKRPPRRLS